MSIGKARDRACGASGSFTFVQCGMRGLEVHPLDPSGLAEFGMKVA
jgi:hypothetical protein